MPNLPRALPTERPAKRRVTFLPGFCILAPPLKPNPSSYGNALQFRVYVFSLRDHRRTEPLPCTS